MLESVPATRDKQEKMKTVDWRLLRRFLDSTMANDQSLELLDVCKDYCHILLELKGLIAMLGRMFLIGFICHDGEIP